MNLPDTLFPTSCKICGQDLARGESILCSGCLETAKFYCEKRFTIPGADDADAPLAYQGFVREAMHAYKFQHRRSYADWLAQMTGDCLAGHFDDWRPDLVTFVPLRLGRWMKRGYNPAALVAKLVAKRFYLPCERILIKCRRTKVQSSIPHEQRMDNVKNAFTVRKNADLQGKRIVLIDDVITTGATASVCAHALREAGAESVLILGMTKTPIFRGK